MDKKKKDYLIISLGFQFLICAIIFGICFGLKTTKSGIITTLKDEYFDKLNDNYLETIIEDKSETIEKTTEVPTVEIVKGASDSKNNLTTTENTLQAEISAEGGADISINSKDDIPPNVSVNGYVLNQKMVLPVMGKTTSEFGVRIHPIDGDLRFHAGVDIAAPTDTPIYAAYDGTVIESEYDRWNGYHIKLQHNNGIMTVYCHCQRLNVKKGEIVKAGDVIATVGSTGSSTGSHLHFELRINNISYDPEYALDEAISAV